MNPKGLPEKIRQKGIKRKGMRRRVSVEEVESFLHSEGYVPTDFFLVDTGLTVGLYAWDERGGIMDLQVEDDDLNEAVMFYMVETEFPRFSTWEAAEAAGRTRRRIISQTEKNGRAV